MLFPGQEVRGGLKHDSFKHKIPRPVRTTLEKFENLEYSLRNRIKMFSVHTTPEKFKKRNNH